MRRTFSALAVVLAAALAGPLPADDDKPADKPAPGEVALTDVDGKQTRVAGARLTTGTRRLGWLADGDAKLGPQYIEVREPNSTTLAKGVLTFVPVASVESVTYDYEKLTAYVAVKGVKEPLAGTLQYRGINTLGVSGTADGKAAAFTAGVSGKAAIKSVVFPDAKPVAAMAGGRSWAVQIVHPAANNPTVKARNLKVLYQFPGGVEQLAAALPVRKGAAVAFDAKLSRFEMLANDTNTNFAAAEVEIDKAEKTVAIPLTVEGEGKRPGTLAGLVGEVEAGYKFFPLHTVKVIVPLSAKAD